MFPWTKKIILMSTAVCISHLPDIDANSVEKGLKISIQYIPRNMHTVFALLCFVVVIHWLIFPYPSGLLHWHCGNLMIAPVPAKQPWWIWINNSCEFIMNDCITTTKQSTTKPCAYFSGYTVHTFIHLKYIPNWTQEANLWQCLLHAGSLFNMWIEHICSIGLLRHIIIHQVKKHDLL